MNHAYNATTVTPPVGGAKKTMVDAFGQTTSVEEHDGTAWRATGTPTTWPGT